MKNKNILLAAAILTSIFFLSRGNGADAAYSCSLGGTYDDQATCSVNCRSLQTANCSQSCGPSYYCTEHWSSYGSGIGPCGYDEYATAGDVPNGYGHGLSCGLLGDPPVNSQQVGYSCSPFCAEVCQEVLLRFYKACSYSCPISGGSACNASNQCSKTTEGTCSCIADNSCAANTCIGSTCQDSCGNAYGGTKNCAPACVADSFCAAETCIGSTCQDSCGNVYAGAKTCTAYSYSWYAGSCTAACGGGTRDVYCWRSDGAQVTDSFCGGSRPSTSCNTQACAAIDNSQFVSYSGIPNYNPATNTASVTTGQSFIASVTFKNTGDTTWNVATGTYGGYKLGTQNPQDNLIWGSGRLLLPSPYNFISGTNVVFTGTFTAPATPGTYDFQWKTLIEGVKWFGGISPNVAITVSAPRCGDGNCNGSENCSNCPSDCLVCPPLPPLPPPLIPPADRNWKEVAP